VLLARSLGVELIYLDEPDPSRMTDSFRENWRGFFGVQQSCFGFRLESVSGCLNVVEKLNDKGIRVVVYSPTPT